MLVKSVLCENVNSRDGLVVIGYSSKSRGELVDIGFIIATYADDILVYAQPLQLRFVLHYMWFLKNTSLVNNSSLKVKGKKIVVHIRQIIF